MFLPRWTHLSFAICSLFLSGCFFSQQQPSNNQLSERTIVSGIVTVEDLHISNQGGMASIQGAFYKVTSKKTDPVSALMDRSTFDTQALPEQMRGPQCYTQKGARNPATRDTETPISVGNVFFGLVLQADLMKLERTTQNIYAAILQANMPAGAYNVAAEGTDGIPQFVEVLSIPEQLDWVRVNGIDFGDLTMEYKKSDKLDISWREPAMSNSENRIQINFVGRTDKEVFKLTCGALESDIMPVKNMKTWSIDPSFLTDVPKGAEIAFQLTRGIVSQRKGSAIATQGLRTFYSQMDYVE